MYRLRGREGIHAFTEGIRFGGLVVLAQAQFPLDDFQLLAEEKFALMLADLFVDLVGNFALQPGNLKLLFYQREDFLHARLQRHGFQNGLQLYTVGTGERSSKVGKRRGLTG